MYILLSINNRNRLCVSRPSLRIYHHTVGSNTGGVHKRGREKGVARYAQPLGASCRHCLPREQCMLLHAGCQRCPCSHKLPPSKEDVHLLKVTADTSSALRIVHRVWPLTIATYFPP